jgi:putative hydrolase
MTLIGDFHTHTSVSHHAYSTVNEMVAAAKAKGLKAIAITNHGPEMLDGAIAHHFLCLPGLPDEVDGVRLLKGVEANIKDFDGRLDLDSAILCKLDFVIASYHVEAIGPGTLADNTRGWINAIRSGMVDCLGHSGNPVFPFEHASVVQECAKHGVAIEINANSLTVRPGSDENCKDVVALCLRHHVPMFINSDAHSMYSVGEFSGAVELVASMGVPESAILNTSFAKAMEFIEQRKAIRRRG